MSKYRATKNTVASVAGQSVTRAAVLTKYAKVWLDSTGTSVAKFSEQLAEVYFSNVPESFRKAPLRVAPVHGDAEDYYRVLSSNSKAVQRYLEGEVPIPAELEETWVSVLPREVRDAAVFELCSRYNVLPVLLTEETDIHALADLMRDEAAVIESLAPILADGQIDESDKPAAREAILRIRKAAASLAGLLKRLEDVAGVESLVVVGAPAKAGNHAGA